MEKCEDNSPNQAFGGLTSIAERILSHFQLVRIHVFAHMAREQCHYATIPRVSSRQDPRQGSENDRILWVPGARFTFV